MDTLWTEQPAEFFGSKTYDFHITTGLSKVPGALWLPTSIDCQGLVLYGHGGSRHKREDTVLDFAEIAVNKYRMAVAAIDGPIHGARQSDPHRTPEETQAAFLSKWKGDDNGVQTMADDWRATLDVLADHPNLSDLNVGYFGLSMGHAYGVPFLANEQRVSAAVIGLWGANYPNSDHLVESAGHIHCPTVSFHMQDDSFFNLDGAMTLFDAIPHKDKRLIIMPGPHNLTTEQTENGLSFLAGHIS